MTSSRNNLDTETHLAPSVLLGEKISAVRRKQVGVAAATGAAMAIGVFIILLGLAMTIDWWLDAPLWSRALMLVWVLGCTLFIAWRFFLTPILRQPDDDTVALRMEKARPEFRSRLISSIQFPRPGVVGPGTASSLARMTIAETEELARPIDFTEIISANELQKVAAWSVAVLALG